MRIARLFLISVLPVLVAALAATPPARAQNAPMEAAAAQIADAISHAKQKSVIVFDFSGPDNQVTALGRHLAGDFSAALGKSGRPLQIEDSSGVEASRKNSLYALDIVLDSESTLLFAQELRVQAIVMGQLSLDHDRLTVKVSSYRTSNGKGIKAVQVSWPLTEDMKGLLAKSLLETDSTTGFASYPKATDKGISPPKCLSCPRVDYSSQALNKKIQGIVVLEAVVETDGSVRNIRVRKALPYGLTQMAIEAVSKWKLSPASGPDGKPVAVRQTIELAFQLF